MEKRAQCVLRDQNQFGDGPHQRTKSSERSRAGARSSTPTSKVHSRATSLRKSSVLCGQTFGNRYPVLPNIKTNDLNHSQTTNEITSHEISQDSGKDIITKPKLHRKNQSDGLLWLAIGQSYRKKIRKNVEKDIKEQKCKPTSGRVMTDKLTLDPNPSRPSKIPLPANHDQLPIRGAVYPHPLCYFGGELKMKEVIKPVEKKMNKKCTRIPRPVGFWATHLSPRKAQNIRSIAYFSEWILKKEIERRIKVERVEIEVEKNLSMLCAQNGDNGITKNSVKRVEVPAPPKTMKHVSNNTTRRVQNVRRAV